jgi:hypothetical protein
MDLHKLVKEILNEKKVKRDRCLRIADRKFDKPSAYKSGAVVRCRAGKIWKDLKEDQINELDVSKYISSWIDTKKLKRPSDFPEAIFLYLKKEGYTNKGEIYRIITLDPLVVMIKQNTEYIDLYRFLEDNQNIEPYSDLYSTYQDEKEVVARLDSNFSFEDIHYANTTGLNMNLFLKNLDKNKLKNDILKKDQGKLLSFTKDKDAANDIFYTSVNFLEDDEDLDETKVKEAFDPQSGKAAPYGSGYAVVKELILKTIQEDESLYKWFKRSGPKGKEGGWVDCNAPDGKGGYKACGRKKGEKRAKYPSCRPTPSKCKSPGKGKKWGKTK